MNRVGPAFPQLLAAAQARQEWAWDRLVRCYGPPVIAYARSQGMSDADDVLGDVLLDVVRRLEGFSGDEDNFRSWVFTIAHSRIVDRRRRVARRKTAEWPEGLDLADESADRAWNDLGDLSATVQALAPDQRDVLLLRTVVGLTVEETAEIVGKSPGAVRVAHHRALERMRRLLGQQGVTQASSPSVTEVR